MLKWRFLLCQVAQSILDKAAAAAVTLADQPPPEPVQEQPSQVLIEQSNFWTLWVYRALFFNLLYSSPSHAGGRWIILRQLNLTLVSFHADHGHTSRVPDARAFLARQMLRSRCQCDPGRRDGRNAHEKKLVPRGTSILWIYIWPPHWTKVLILP